MGIRESEISLLCQMIPKDQFGRSKYNAPNSTFFDTLSKVIRTFKVKNEFIYHIIII